jgi:hypothetical protein
MTATTEPPGLTETKTETRQQRAKPLDGLVKAFWLMTMAEDKRFELLRACTQHAFQACALGH